MKPAKGKQKGGGKGGGGQAAPAGGAGGDGAVDLGALWGEALGDVELMRLKSRLEDFKAEGNLSFTSEDYAAALERYSAGLSLHGVEQLMGDPHVWQHPTGKQALDSLLALFNNRAATYLKLGAAALALRDTSATLHLCRLPEVCGGVPIATHTSAAKPGRSSSSSSSQPQQPKTSVWPSVPLGDTDVAVLRDGTVDAHMKALARRARALRALGNPIRALEEFYQALASAHAAGRAVPADVMADAATLLPRHGTGSNIINQNSEAVRDWTYCAAAHWRLLPEPAAGGGAAAARPPLFSHATLAFFRGSMYVVGGALCARAPSPEPIAGATPGGALPAGSEHGFITRTDTRLRDVWAMDLSTRAWRLVETPTTPNLGIPYAPAAVLGGRVYCYQGSRQVLVLDLEQQQWSSVMATWPRNAHKVRVPFSAEGAYSYHMYASAACPETNRIYYFGGTSGTGPDLNTLVCFDVASSTWEVLDEGGKAGDVARPDPCVSPTMWAACGRLFVLVNQVRDSVASFKGHVADTPCLPTRRSFWSFDLATRKWTNESSHLFGSGYGAPPPPSLSSPAAPPSPAADRSASGTGGSSPSPPFVTPMPPAPIRFGPRFGPRAPAPRGDATNLPTSTYLCSSATAVAGPGGKTRYTVLFGGACATYSLFPDGTAARDSMLTTSQAFLHDAETGVWRRVVSSGNCPVPITGAGIVFVPDEGQDGGEECDGGNGAEKGAEREEKGGRKKRRPNMLGGKLYVVGGVSTAQAVGMAEGDVGRLVWELEVLPGCKGLQGTCAACGKVAKLKQCGGSCGGAIAVCGPECHKATWGAHKRWCGKVE